MKNRSILALLAAALPLAAMATPVRYEFTGELNSRGTSLPEWYTFEFPNGTAFSGSFILETDAVPYAADASLAFYGAAVTNVQVSFGVDGSLGTYSQSDRPIFDGYPYTSNLYFLDDFDSASGFGYDYVSLAVNLEPAPGDSPLMLRSFSLSGLSLDASMFTGVPALDQFPQFAPQDLWSMGVGVLLGEGEGQQQAGFGGSVTSLRQVSSVPEPATWTLLAAGLAGVGIARRRRA
jgi:hypothetical protein